MAALLATSFMTDVSTGPSSLNGQVRAYRVRIDPHTRRLGPYARTANRIGRPISQEEVAEAVGVSRQWYSKLELYPQIRVSIRLIGRLADVLMLNQFERESLFKSAIPEIFPYDGTSA